MKKLLIALLLALLWGAAFPQANKVKIFAVTDNTYVVKQHFLTSDVYGIVLRPTLGNFLYGDKYNETAMSEMKQQIKLCKAAGKKVRIGVQFGYYCTTNFYNQYGYVEFIEKHHQGMGPPLYIKVPIFYKLEFLTKTADFFKWFRDRLQADTAVWSTLEGIDITVVNQKSEEFRVPDQDFQPIGDPFKNASIKWIAAGYKVDTVRAACKQIIKMFGNLFPGKVKAFPIIGGLNGFPRINSYGFCAKKAQPDISGELIEYGNTEIEDFKVKWCALNDSCVIPPGVSIMQLYKVKWGNPDISLRNDFIRTIQYGIDHGAEEIEVFDRDLVVFPDVIKTFKY